MYKVTICHPERPKIIVDFRRESKDLRTDLTAMIIGVRRFFDSADAPLRMTDLGDCASFRLADSSRSAILILCNQFTPNRGAVSRVQTISPKIGKLSPGKSPNVSLERRICLWYSKVSHYALMMRIKSETKR